MSKTIKDILQNVEFEGKKLDVILNEDGEPLFELYSIGVALGYTRWDGKSYFEDGSQKLFPRKDRIDKVVKNAEIIGVPQSGQIYLSEEEVYDFMLEAHTEPCKRFKKWLSSEVLPSIRKYGIYRDREEVDNNYTRFTYKALKETFSNAPIENIEALYTECMDWYKNENIRIVYAPNSKKRSGTKHSKSESKLMVMQKIVSVLEERNVSLLENRHFGLIQEVDQVIIKIKDDITRHYNYINGGKLAYANKRINILEQELETFNPNESNFVECKSAPISNNAMYEAVLDINSRVSEDGKNQKI